MKPEPPREAADLARLLQLPAERELPGSRHRMLKEYLMQEIAQQQGETQQEGRLRGAWAGGRRPRRRIVGIAAPLVAVATAVAVFAVTGGSGGSGGSVAGGGTTGAATATAGTGTGNGGGDGDQSQTVQELGRIATVADSKSLPVASDDQFVYVESKVAWEEDTGNSSGYHSKLQPLHLRQIWQSVDGSRPGLVRESGQDMPLTPLMGTPSPRAAGSNVPVFNGSGPTVMDPDYRFLQSLPTDPAQLLKLIYAQTKGQGPSPDSEAFEAIGAALREQIAPPAVTAALYRAAAMIPGVRVIEDVVDVTGRHDLAVALDNQIAANEWLFDKSSLDYVGEQTVSLKADSFGPAGTIEGTQIILDRAIVDRAGEVPTGSSS